MKQLAVEWYSQQHLKLLIKLENKELSIGEYAVQHQEILNQAKEMEKQQSQETFKQSRQAKIFEKDMPPVWESWEQYYNETFKQTIK